MPSSLHNEVLTEEQLNLLPLVRAFSKGFGLVGGSAFALYIGHRRSIDFDLFTNKEFDNLKIKRKISKFFKINQIIRDESGQYTIVIKDVRFTFFHYPYEIKFSKNFDDIIKLPNLLTLAAMKAHALGRRAKWKDYVDLYFVMRDYHHLNEIIKKAEQIFHSEFNEKLFRMQLAYFKDINYAEKVIYLKGLEVSDKIIKKGLIEFSLKT